MNCYDLYESQLSGGVVIILSSPRGFGCWSNAIINYQMVTTRLNNVSISKLLQSHEQVPITADSKRTVLFAYKQNDSVWLSSEIVSLRDTR